MSAYEDRIDGPVFDRIEQAEIGADFIATTEAQLLADDDVYAEGLSDACFDVRTASQVVALFRAGDLLRAAQIMRDHVQTYVSERAEVKADEVFRL
jgi:hypothetical protein